MNFKFLAFSAGIFAALSGVYLFIEDQNTNIVYRGIYILPLIFVVVVLIMIKARQICSATFGYTFAFFASVTFIRLVVTPLAIHIAGPNYTALTYLSVTPEDVFTAILLIAWESIAAAIFFLMTAATSATMRSSGMRRATPITLLGSKVVYRAVALIGVALIFVVGIPHGLLNFGAIAESTAEIERSSFDMLLIQIMIAGAWLTYLLTLAHQGDRYRRRAALAHFLLAQIIGILLLALIFGDRRSIQVYSGIAVATTLVAVFPDKRRTIFTSVFIAGMVVIASISFWRMFARHDIELTSAALLGESIMATIATTLQSYMGGPYQIAAANSVLLSEGIGLGNVAFDFLRSFFGLNFFVDRSQLLTSQIMNDNIYSGNFLSGWLVFTTSYGAVTLGAVFMPTFLMLNMSLAMWCENVFRKTRGLEVKFLFVYLFTRISFSPFIATPLLLSFFTIQLFTIGLVFFVAITLKSIGRSFIGKRSWI